MEETLIILDKVNLFYSQSFSQLVVITLAVLGFVGVLLPILLSLYQKRIFKLEHKEILNSLQENLKENMNAEMEKIREEYRNKEEVLMERISESEEKFEKKISSSLAGVLHVQGNMYLARGSHEMALKSLLNASLHNLNCDDEGNLRACLRIICNDCLPNVNQCNSLIDEETTELHDQLVSMLKKCNENGRYRDVIKSLKLPPKLATTDNPTKQA